MSKKGPSKKSLANIYKSLITTRTGRTPVPKCRLGEEDDTSLGALAGRAPRGRGRGRISRVEQATPSSSTIPSVSSHEDEEEEEEEAREEAEERGEREREEA